MAYETYEISRFKRGELADVNNIDAQFALLKLFGLPETAAERYYVEVRGEQKVLCKRESPVSIFEDVNGNRRSILAGQRTGAERSRFDAKRGKYNDSGRLGDEQYYGDRRPIGDVQAWYA